MESKHPRSLYDSVPATDEQDESLSTTDVDESLMGEDKQWPATEQGSRIRSRRKRITALDAISRLANTVLLLVIAALLAAHVFRNRPANEASYTRQVGGDFSGAGPEFSTRVVKWQGDASYVPSNLSDFFSTKTIAQWNRMMPAGTGWGSGNETFFTTSMTHQLHCVFMMARIYAGVVSGTGHSLPVDYHTHYLHCVDYLRQAIMCAGDVAMEPHEQTDADDNGPMDGSWNGYHVCKDYGEIIGYLEKQIASGVRTVLPIDD